MWFVCVEKWKLTDDQQPHLFLIIFRNGYLIEENMLNARQMCLQGGGVNIRTLINSAVLSSHPCSQKSECTHDNSSSNTDNVARSGLQDPIPITHSLKLRKIIDMTDKTCTNNRICQDDNFPSVNKKQNCIQYTDTNVTECQKIFKRKCMLSTRDRQGNNFSKHTSVCGHYFAPPTQHHSVAQSSYLETKRLRTSKASQSRPFHFNLPFQIERHRLPYHATHCHKPHHMPASSFMPSRSFRTSSHPDLVEMKSVDDFHGPTVSQMTTFLGKHKLGCSVGYTCLVAHCPFCEGGKALASTGSRKQNEVDSVERNVYINQTTGWTSCQCAKTKGSWEKFQDSVYVLKKKRKTAKPPLSALPIYHDDIQDEKETDPVKGNVLWDMAVEIAQCDDDYLQKLKTKFPIQKFTMKTLEHFHVRVNKSNATLLVPVYGAAPNETQLQGVVILDVEEDEDQQRNVVETHWSRSECHSGLLGYNLIKADSTEVILTESVLDALAVHQGTSTPVLSLPHHANGAPMIPQEILPLLEPFKTVTLWFNNDMRSWEVCKQFAKKLNSKRCQLIRPLDDHPSPLTALNNKKYLGPILKKAVPVSHKFITSFRALRQEVLSELCHADQVAGVKWKRFQHLNKLLKGHRRGELTVFTGPTGSGKTTFMAEYSLDLCVQGVNTLWGSFEIQNTRLAKVMLTQYTGLNLSKDLDKFDESADKFEKLPLYFMAFHGEQSLQKVLEAMNHAVYVHDIQHVIIDNLQFMVGYSDSQTSFDRFSVYDKFIAAFRAFATNNNCHVSLVIHPRKEREIEELHTSSIFGSAKASQEADNVLILQDQTQFNPSSRKYIQVTKNRFDGETGKMPLYFNKETLVMSQAPARKKRKAKDKEDNIKGDENDLFSLESSDVVKEYNIEDDELDYQE
ncbi:twinkle mtDNA helicase-like [Amphiura filiformis]|uniref:twinkle mtDNA helicase-like n=1 Tax=Amphiura filiformis TaxID=82378 RepID=UPI003B2116EE